MVVSRAQHPAACMSGTSSQCPPPPGYVPYGQYLYYRPGPASLPVPVPQATMTRNQRLEPQAVHPQASTFKQQQERAIREAYRKEKKIESYLADDENFPSFAIQLKKLGLQLRDIPADG